MKTLKNAFEIFKRQTTFNKVLLIIALLYLFFATFIVFSAIGWWTVFTSIALTIVINMWSNLSEQIRNKEFENKENNETH